jgi:hypothetical protein
MHHWADRRPIRHISMRRDQSRSRRGRERNLPPKRLETVQMNQATSLKGLWIIFEN